MGSFETKMGTPRNLDCFSSIVEKQITAIHSAQIANKHDPIRRHRVLPCLSCPGLCNSDLFSIFFGRGSGSKQESARGVKLKKA
jgi:hypothetical protein